VFRPKMISDSGMIVITLLRSPECFPQGEVTLDITEGKLFSEGNLEEQQRANQENVHAKD